MQSFFASFQPDRWYENFALDIDNCLSHRHLMMCSLHHLLAWNIVLKSCFTNEILGKVRAGTGISTLAPGYMLWK